MGAPFHCAMARNLLTLMLAGVTIAVHADVPTLPSEYSAVVMMRMPYFGLEMPLRVLTTSTTQKIEFYDGLEVDVSSANGTHKFVFENGKRGCLYSPPSSGPTEGLMASEWQPKGFLPDLSQYTLAADELVGGTMCRKFIVDETHGSTGTMDDHVAFYWDPVLEKPVTWQMHSRHKTFGSHTDEYIMDFLSFQAGPPSESDMALPELCQKSAKHAPVSIQVGALLEAAHSRSHGEAVPKLFEAFLKQHGKSYTPKEHVARRAIFEQNLQLIDRLNEQHQGAARFRGNRFLDMTVEEVLRFRGGQRKGSKREQRRTPEMLQFVQEHKAGLAAVKRPTNFDWRTAKPGVIGPVKDQAACGSCWAFGLVGPVEAMHAIQTGERIELAEQFIVDCTWVNGTGDSGSNQGCDGGNSDIGALEVVKKYGGVFPSTSSYGSYLSVNGFCKDTQDMDSGAKIAGWVDVKSRDEESLLDALVTKGPISVSIMVPGEMLYYDSGVLKVESCRHNATEIDHAVVLVGYGTDEHGTDYYTIRNSWSTYWGDEGHIKIARGDLDCCVSEQPGYPQVVSKSDTGASIVV